MESTTWLVTGGSGFIGTNLIERLSKRGINAYNVDIRPPIVGDQQALWRELDICDRTALINTVCTVKPDIIVHLAAKADFDPNPESFYGPNVEGTRNLLDGALLCKVSRVILTSTQYVNGPLKPFADDRVYYPVNAYGESKVRMEQLARTVPYEPL
ncbi:MAG TPA: NAD(P)-dependent oxidoreductase, partial [Methylocella sp.]|nr:NAD(P)-dependent oxidoreductase [Methylocella sp.]